MRSIKIKINSNSKTLLLPKSGANLDSRNKIRETRDRAREVMKYLVEEAGLPVSDRALGWVAGDAGSLATCREARRGPGSLQILARRAVRGLPRV